MELAVVVNTRHWAQISFHFLPMSVCLGVMALLVHHGLEATWIGCLMGCDGLLSATQITHRTSLLALD